MNETKNAAWTRIHESLPSIGAASTAVTAIVASVGLLVTILSSDRQREVLAAAEIRRDLLAFAHEVRALSDALNDGSLVFIAADAVVEEWLVDAGKTEGTVSPDDLWKHISENDEVAISAAVNGWYSHDLALKFDDKLTNATRASYRLIGAYSLLRESLGMFENVIATTYSPIPFAEFFTDLVARQDELKAMLPLDVRELRKTLRHNVQARALAQNDNQRLLSDVIQMGVSCLVRFPDGKLIALTEISPPRSSDTYTQTLLEFERLVRWDANLPGDTHCETMSSAIGELDDRLAAVGDVS